MTTRLGIEAWRGKWLHYALAMKFLTDPTLTWGSAFPPS